ncbi:MAG: histidinol-phosphatase HisJ family protein [Lachnospiraceae bacterium]|nr:histidinol-phosphatase HisJ family protein [Lachnospiraceae bacterium]
MPIIADYHLHSSYSKDSIADMEEMIIRAVALGLDRMCFTEHMDIDFPVSEEMPEGFFILDTDDYFRQLAHWREKYSDRIAIGFGVELGIQPHLKDILEKYVSSYDFDFVIGSAHVANGKDPYAKTFFAGRSDRNAYREYFESIYDDIISFNDFDVFGHLDYVVRYGMNKDRDYFCEEYFDVFRNILTELVNKGKGIEINTGGFRYGLRELHPFNAILKLYRELGGEIITIGSDAHDPSDICRVFDRANETLAECGFKYYTVFDKRKPIFVKI